MFIINNGLEYKLSDKEQEYVRGYFKNIIYLYLFLFEKKLIFFKTKSKIKNRYCDLIGDHLDKTFLCQLPEQFKSLTNKNMSKKL